MRKGSALDSEQPAVPRTVSSDFNDLPNYFDGMGEATVRILIKRRLSEKLLREYGVVDLKNIGRYYSAKILAQDGSTIDEVLVDKQCGAITSLRKVVE